MVWGGARWVSGGRVPPPAPAADLRRRPSSVDVCTLPLPPLTHFWIGLGHTDNPTYFSLRLNPSFPTRSRDRILSQVRWIFARQGGKLK